ncbi:hypothetical protein LOC67_19500 [Stieleria sp. JC731]|uniref:hypothetical protein n=1 Tax=Pirellulaceae TaxID=2691357 RepID=UPI001E30F85C|nr:hypothetical protein [Stieleria sp. JC731]MCC9602741.1 hypothetical protein [Stieleria sp. JC731]
MDRSFKKLINDANGSVISIELVAVATTIAIGLLVGFTAVRDGIVVELADTASSVQEMNQSFSYQGAAGHSGTTVGSDFIDGSDYMMGQTQACISFSIPPSNNEGKWDVSDYGAAVVFGPAP